MYGFKPRHAQGKPVQNLADGGIVHSLTGMLGMRKRTPEEMLASDAKTQAQNQEAAARVAARNQAAQESAPPPEKAITSYTGMSAMQRREKEAGLKDGGTVGGFKPGGLIRGPGTGTSDSIETEKKPGTFIMPADSTQTIGPEVLEELAEPMEAGEKGEGMETEGAENEGPEEKGEGETVPVRLSNGEFEYTPQQVQALGEAVLTVLRDATHTPVEGGKPTAKGFAPNQFFANGGTVFGSRGLAGLREVIPKVQAMGYPQAQQPAQAPAGSRDLAALKAMIPKMEAMGYTQALADGGMVENDVTRVGNSYSGGNVGGNITVNGQKPGGSVSSASPVPSNPVPATPSATPAAAPSAATAPATATATPAPSVAPMGWAERNAQRSNEVTASSIMDSPERRAAQAKLTPTPAPVAPVAPTAPAIGGIQSPATAMDATKPKAFGAQAASPFGFKPRGYAGGGVVKDEEKQRLANQTAMYVQGAQEAASKRPTETVAAPAPAPVAKAEQPSEYSRQMGAVGSALADGAAWLGKTIVSAPGYGFNRPDAPAPTQRTASTAGAGRGSVNPAAVVPANVTTTAPVTAEETAQTAAVPTQAAAEPAAAPQTTNPNQVAAGFVPGGAPAAISQVVAPTVRNSTNDWAARKALENMATAASSITNRPEWQSGSSTIAGSTRGPNGAGDPEGKVAAYKAALANDLALQQAQPNMEQAAMRENGANQRATLQDQGATARTVIQDQGATTREAGRTALTAEELGLRREAQGFQTRAAAQRENLRNTLIDPKATPEQRKQAQVYLQALAVSDKEPSPQYKSYVMPPIRNADGSTTEGSVYQENTRTGEGRWVKPQGDGQAQQAMPKPASKAEFDALPKGTRFTDPNGQVRIK